ncbi:MAG TPA: hypothetical protein VK053_16785 [Jiangellaceae bacterium]|nr:hypothetical protein [Jiangellaceae bacterium]
MASPPAERYARLQTEEIAAATAAAERLWSRMTVADIDGSWEDVAPQLNRVATTGQNRVGSRVDGNFEEILIATGNRAAATPVARVNPEAMTGWAGDGRPVHTLLNHAPARAKALIAAGFPAFEAMRRSGTFVAKAVATVVGDTARHSESLSMAVRPRVTTYVRMIEPGACSRCAILAGREYRGNQGFERHPACRCTHIPAVEAIEGDPLLDPKAYFDSLSVEDQDRIFTTAGAEAIRAGADPAQVVNVRRGMSTAQPHEARGWRARGRQAPEADGLYTTTEGATSRGRAYEHLATDWDRERVQEVWHFASTPRLMPESIVEMATNRDELIELLTANGYIL